MNAFKVLASGPLTTIQDQGRYGYHHLGLTEGGPMDTRSFQLSNRLVGNTETAAALEITLGGLTLECLTHTTIALTGAFCPLIINEQPKALWQSHTIKKGDIIKIGFTAIGVRAYLAVTGGFNSDKWFESQSTVIREGIGQALQKGQVLNINPSSAKPRLKLDFRYQPSLRKSATLQFVSGYQWDDFPAKAKQQLLNGHFVISKQNDRMGYRLKGDKIMTDQPQLMSEGISLGAIQITGHGDPIILMRDRQTIGGYPKAGSVTQQSLNALAQLSQGATISFEIISAEDSIKQQRAYQNAIETCPLLTY